ncbi:MAG: hypothetical protein KBC81_03515 [Candidatus Pacebacteria bacterium]|nr:hypothetical protein [Candidatus Paceibacterota bacterium]
MAVIAPSRKKFSFVQSSVAERSAEIQKHIDRIVGEAFSGLQRHARFARVVRFAFSLSFFVGINDKGAIAHAVEVYRALGWTVDYSISGSNCEMKLRSKVLKSNGG